MSYELMISRKTVDRLGVKLYDRASAVVAELVANAYDADATTVTARLPLPAQLARKRDDGIEDKGFVIEVSDDGHGMDPAEAQDHYLKVGRDRRRHPELSSRSRKGREVIGRKGIGKLAAFGICRRIEIRSAGGPRTPDGFRVSHFFLDYDRIDTEDEAPVPLETGPLDQTFAEASGTFIRLSSFLVKRVPDRKTFMRQLARRFGPTCELSDFQIRVENVLPEPEPEPVKVSRVQIPFLEGTKIVVDDRPVRPVHMPDLQLPVRGFLAFSKDAYRTEESGGVAIYARGKIVATTRDFGLEGEFPGEFALRSYLVGEIEADWLDEEEDLVRTDRRDILWDSDLGRALKDWGRDRMMEIARLGREPRRRRVRDRFLDTSKIEERARKSFADEDVVAAVVELAGRVGEFAAEDELADQAYVDGLAKIILSVGPYRALIEFFRAIPGKPLMDDFLVLSQRTQIAEWILLGKIADERVQAIDQLQEAICGESEERKLQQLVARWPWLIEPSWSVIAVNQALKTFRDQLQTWLKRRDLDLEIAVGLEAKRPDFTLINVGREIRLVELKACGHAFADADWDRLANYIAAMEDLFRQSGALREEFPGRWKVELIADDVAIQDRKNLLAYESQLALDKLVRRRWDDFLLRAKKANEAFLDARKR